MKVKQEDTRLPTEKDLDERFIMATFTKKATGAFTIETRRPDIESFF